MKKPNTFRLSAAKQGYRLGQQPCCVITERCKPSDRSHGVIRQIYKPITEMQDKESENELCQPSIATAALHIGFGFSESTIHDSPNSTEPLHLSQHPASRAAASVLPPAELQFCHQHPQQHIQNLSREISSPSSHWQQALHSHYHLCIAVALP